MGLALPNLMAGATHDLEPHQAATGSGVVTMARQIGFVVGVSILFAILGDRTGVLAIDAFTNTFMVAAAVLVASALTAFGMAARTKLPTPVAGQADAHAGSPAA